MNEEYWKNFYKTHTTREPSSFARFCLKYINKEVVDVGCGDGRDSYYFAKNGVYVHGIDKATKPKKAHNVTFHQTDFRKVEFCKIPVYARFFLHAISGTAVRKLINKCNSIVMFEFRNTGDVPTIYTNHERNMVDGLNIVEDLRKRGFKILWYQLDRGLAKFKGEDPLICRIVARKEHK